ncbi:MAG: hypothetical protein U0353_06940 [Sandaracinus sp.]
MLRTTDIDGQTSNHAGWTAIASVSSRSVERAGLPSGTNTCSRTEGMDQRAALGAGREEDAYVAEVAPRTSVQASRDRITNHDGSYVLITYDDALRVQSEAYRDAGGGVLDNIEYTYDLVGNRRTRRHGATPATSTFEEYTYAAGDELTSVSVGGSPTQTWEHDAAGRTTRITRSGHDQHLAYDADDHITSIVDGAAETRWQFDAEGRRSRREDLSGGVTDSAHRYVQGPTTDASLDSAHMITTDAGAEELAYVFAPIPGGAEHPLFRYDPTIGRSRLLPPRLDGLRHRPGRPDHDADGDVRVRRLRRRTSLDRHPREPADRVPRRLPLPRHVARCERRALLREGAGLRLGSGEVPQQRSGGGEEGAARDLRGEPLRGT